ASAEQPGYRSALEVTYGKTADQLEAEWAAYLPAYFEGRWQINAIYAYDLADVTTLVEQGAYTDAESQLTEIIGLLEATDQAETLAQAETLLAQARQGRAARAMADEARLALLADNYPQAIEKGQAALAAYEALDYRARVPEIQNYIYRAELGQAALAKLGDGERLLDSLRFFEAERHLTEATSLLQALGNEAGAAQGATLLAESAWRQQLIVYALIVVAALLLVVNTMRRLFNYFLAEPLEMEFTT
ncbi:MAG: hypothetical protein KDF65_08595, partial [Anaerolineae bacterium]|nr:hypothetical protein [Anaerolineae bacterium]